MQGTRSQQRQSAPTGPFSRRRVPWSRGAGLASTLCLSSPDSRAGLGLEEKLQAASSLTPGDPRRVGDPRGGWAAFRRPAGPASAPPFLPQKPTAGCAGRPCGPAPSGRLQRGLFLRVRPPSPVAPASAARGAGCLSALPGRAGCRGAAAGRRQARGETGRPEWAAVSLTRAHPLAAAGSYRRSSPGGRHEETSSGRGRVNTEVLEPATPQATVETVGIRPIRPPKAS